MTNQKTCAIILTVPKRTVVQTVRKEGETDVEAQEAPDPEKPKREERSDDTASKLQIAAALLGLALKVFEVIEKILDKLD